VIIFEAHTSIHWPHFAVLLKSDFKAEVGFVEHTSRTWAGQQSMNRYELFIVINMVTPKAAAKLPSRVC
jgi:hypothetical protein